MLNAGMKICSAAAIAAFTLLTPLAFSASPATDISPSSSTQAALSSEVRDAIETAISKVYPALGSYQRGCFLSQRGTHLQGSWFWQWRDYF